MLDYRIYTFLSLCETLNYTKTARLLNMTQPGVTQHVQLLEKEYGCRLLRYSGKVLSLTEEGVLLEKHLRVAVAAERVQKVRFSAPEVLPLRIGATKTIGDYVIPEVASALAQDDRYRLVLDIDNTKDLLRKLDRFELDLALIEGFFDQSHYQHRLIRKERFVGICGKSHPFAGKSVSIDELFTEHILLREQGSGTRSIFETVLQNHHYTIDAFSRQSCVNSFSLIRHMVRAGVGISFVYQSILDSDDTLGSFSLSGEEIFGEFNYVFLPSNCEVPWFLAALDQVADRMV